MTDISTLNLTRKWRAQRFETLVGQELVVKILKNSLYSNHFFPVYLFSGQRGCGKTSTARIFAAALNCAQLPHFQQKPKEIAVPCGSCDSCNAFFAVRHPDFIEIDAASHTGVDNMRAIIDAAYYLPVLGRKKIYLIDEAHMLSKAAFNALLKLFEEPPLHAHFILATTDPEKIIETVRSRCFTLFFDAIDTATLATHLEHLCKQEQIAYTTDALLYIARCAEGSARDAINLLETVRFSYPSVDKGAVLTVLGHIDDQQLASLIRAIGEGNALQFLQLWHTFGDRIAAPQLWQSVVRIVRGMIWYHHGVIARDIDNALGEALKTIPLAAYTVLLDQLYHIEPLFIRTSDQRGLLEFLFLQLCARFKKNSGGTPPNQSTMALPAQEFDLITIDEDSEEEGEDDSAEEDESTDDSAVPVLAVEQKATPQSSELVSLCRQQFALITDPILASMIVQVVSISYDDLTRTVTLHFASHHTFFADTLAQATALWHPVVRALYADLQVIQYAFDAAATTTLPERLRASASVKKITSADRPAERPVQTAAPVMPARAQYANNAVSYKKVQQPLEKKIDISDKERWPLTNRVLTHFPGTVTLVNEAQL